MFGNPLERHPPHRQLLVVCVVVPVVVVLAVLAFAWPAARIAPRDLPVGVVGTASGGAIPALTGPDPGAFELRLYADDAAARSAIRHRDVYGAFEMTPSGTTVLTASAASPSVAQLLTTAAQQAAGQLPVTAIDVVPLAPADPKGVVFSSVMLPLVLGGVIVAVVLGLFVRFRPAWRHLLSLAVVCAVAGLGAYLVAQGFLGGLPGQHLATWGALALILFAISAAVAGCCALLGPAGIGLGAGLMIFVGNPFSGASSAPELLPDPVGQLGAWLPPGAGANLLRSTAYFDGHGAAGHLLVLALWAGFGIVAVITGHHRAGRHSAIAPQSAELQIA